MLTLDDARTAVMDLCEPTLDPTLDTSVGGDIDKALTRTAVAVTWTATTAYAFGQKIVPTAPMGRVFICTHEWTTGTTEPTWLIAPVYVAGRNPLGGWGFASADPLAPSLFGLADGTCAFCDAGPFAGEMYDVMSAAAECWMVKSRKAANQVDKRVGDLSASKSQLIQHCLQMARSLRPVRVV